MPLDQAKERATQLESEVTSLERYVQVKISNDIADSIFSWQSLIKYLVS